MRINLPSVIFLLTMFATALFLTVLPEAANTENTPRSLEEIVHDLSSMSTRTRSKACLELFTDERPVSVDDGKWLITEATKEYPETPGWHAEAILIAAATWQPSEDYIAPIEAGFEQFRSTPARRLALHALLELDSSTGYEAFFRILETHARSGNVTDLPDLPTPVDYQDELFPRLFEFLDVPKLNVEICQLCLDCLTENDTVVGLLNQDAINQIRSVARSGLSAGSASVQELCVMSQLMGYLPGNEEILRQLMEHNDARVAHSALVALLRSGADVREAELRALAENVQTRSRLLHDLQELGLSNRFPTDLYNQRFIAEGDMVHWLCHPAELGAPPQEIDFVERITRNADGIEVAFFVFRFLAPEGTPLTRNGWMAGVAGPYPTDTPVETGRAFSAFTPWESLPNNEHVDEINAIVSGYE